MMSVFKEEQQFKKDIEKRIHDGESIVDIIVDYENKMRVMKRTEECDSDSCLNVLSNIVEDHHTDFIEEYFKLHGWIKLRTGRWDAIEFENEKHKQNYQSIFIKMKCKNCVYQTTAYLMSLADLVPEDVFDFELNSIKPEGLYASWQTAPKQRATRLIFNLWNDYCNDIDESGNWVISSTYTVYELFSGITPTDRRLQKYFFEAIRIRFNSELKYDFEDIDFDAIDLSVLEDNYETESAENNELDDILNMSVVDMSSCGCRAMQGYKRADIETIGQLIKLTKPELYQIMSKQCADKVIDELSNMGLKLTDS